MIRRLIRANVRLSDRLMPAIHLDTHAILECERVVSSALSRRSDIVVLDNEAVK